MACCIKNCHPMARLQKESIAEPAETIFLSAVKFEIRVVAIFVFSA
tara:strand:+ start:1408 stop:1545 length:138 start_codon:yes stop_codon:yes gene_type:complete